MSINLLPSEAKFQASRIRFKKKVVDFTYFLIAAWVFSLVVVYAFWLINRKFVNDSAVVLDKAETAYGKLSTFLITNQKLRYKVKLVSSILDSRFEYGKAFRTINTLFTPEVVIKRLDLNDDSTFSVEAEVVGFENMDTVEKRIKNINDGKSEDFSNVKITQLSVMGNLWKFSLKVALK